MSTSPIRQGQSVDRHYQKWSTIYATKQKSCTYQFEETARQNNHRIKKSEAKTLPTLKTIWSHQRGANCRWPFQLATIIRHLKGIAVISSFLSSGKFLTNFNRKWTFMEPFYNLDITRVSSSWSDILLGCYMSSEKNNTQTTIKVNSRKSTIRRNNFCDCWLMINWPISIDINRLIIYRLDGYWLIDWISNDQFSSI